jgi:hypothetical protein
VDLTEIANELNRTVPQCRDQWLSDKLVTGDFSQSEKDLLLARNAALKNKEECDDGFYINVGLELNRNRLSVRKRLLSILTPPVPKALKKRKYRK